MLISRPSNSGLKRLINIQKCRSSTKLDHCAMALACTAYLSNLASPFQTSASYQKALHVLPFCSNGYLL